MKSFIINANDAGQRISKFVEKTVPALPNNLLYKSFRLKRIKRNGKGAKRDVRLVGQRVDVGELARRRTACRKVTWSSCTSTTNFSARADRTLFF